MSYICQSPILFIIFNRPETTRRVFEEIRKTKPPRLYIAADGPRANVPQDQENIKACRTIVAQVDWDCVVHTLFRERNLGCGKAVSSAITWFFENEPQGVILEDDCLPAEDFFRFCDEMLCRFHDNTRIMQISGFNLLGNASIAGSYYFSRIGSIWGWASWRRAWSHYQHEIDTVNLDQELEKLEHLWVSWREKHLRRRQFTAAGHINTWDYQWLFAKLKNSGLTVVPGKNLIENIGFGHSATHTREMDDRSSIQAYGLTFPLKHPELVDADAVLERRTFLKAHPRWIDFKSKLLRSSRKLLAGFRKTD